MEEGDVVLCPHVVVHFHPSAKVIRLCIFENEECLVAVVKVWHNYSVLILVTSKQPPMAHVPEQLPRFFPVLLLLVEMHCHTHMNVSCHHIVLSYCDFWQPEYNMVQEEVHERLGELDLLHEGIVPALHVQIYNYTSSPNIREETHKLADITHTNVPISTRQTTP